MGLNEPGSSWKGRQLFINVELVSSYVLMIVIMVFIFMGLIEFLPILGLIIFIYILSFVAILQYSIRKHSEEYSGLEILDSWIDLEFNVGEEFLFPIAKVDIFPDISPNAKDAVDRFVNEMGRYAKSIDELEGAIKELDKELINGEEKNEKD